MTKRARQIDRLPKNREFIVDLLAVVFGVGAWISVNGLWVELPLLVSALPEGWALPSYMSIVIQIANIGPILYSALHVWIPKYVNEKPSIYLLMIIGTISSLLIAFFWDATSNIAGVEHSTGLLGLLFCLSLVDCSSSVLFMPFMARFRMVYLASYLIGEGLSGFLPSIVALAQGVGGNPECRNVSTQINGSYSWHLEAYYPEPRFSITAFFFILMSLMISSALAFVGLNHCRVARREQIALKPSNSRNATVLTAADNDGFASSIESVDVSFASSIPAKRPVASVVESESAITDDQRVNTEISRSVLIYVLLIQAWVCALSNGGLPSIQSYSCLPYGNVAYHLAVTLSAMANPLSCLIAYFMPITNICMIVVFAVAGTAVASYVVLLAAMSPAPILVGTPGGETLMVTAWIACVGLLTYVKVSIAFILRMQEGKGDRNLFWFGVFTQVGSAIGSIVAFVFVNVYQLFQSYYPCA